MGSGMDMIGFRHFVVLTEINGRLLVLDPTITQFRYEDRLPAAVLCVGLEDKDVAGTHADVASGVVTIASI